MNDICKGHLSPKQVYLKCKWEIFWGEMGENGRFSSPGDGAAHRQGLATEVSWGTLAIAPRGVNGFPSSSPASEPKMALALESLLVE